MITELRVSGYRSIRTLRLTPNTVNVIVGPNGYGKTNLYRSLFLLSAAANGELARTLADEGGMPSVLWAGLRPDRPVRMTIRVTVDDFSYELSCGLPEPTRSLFSLDPMIQGNVMRYPRRSFCYYALALVVPVLLFAFHPMRLIIRFNWFFFGLLLAWCISSVFEYIYVLRLESRLGTPITEQREARWPRPLSLRG